MFTKFKPVIFLVSAIGTIMLASLIIVTVSNKPEVTHHERQVREGYENVPESYTITASAKKQWHDNHSAALVVIGLIIALVGVPYYAYRVTEDGDKGSWAVVVILLIISAALIFGKYATKSGDSSYTTELTPTEYESNKSNLDALFPAIDK